MIAQKMGCALALRDCISPSVFIPRAIIKFVEIISESFDGTQDKDATV